MTAQVLFFNAFFEKDLHLNAVENLMSSIWALIHNLCRELMTQLEGLRESNVNCKRQEGIWVKNEKRCRWSIKITRCFGDNIYLLKPETHVEIILVNICSRVEARSDININNSLEIGAKVMIRFQESLRQHSKPKLWQCPQPNRKASIQQWQRTTALT